MEYLLLTMTIIFLFLNLIITKKDYMHPGNIVIGIFLIYKIFLILGQEYYKIKVEVGLVYTFLIFYTIIMLISILSESIFKHKYIETNLEYIEIKKMILYGFILVQFVWIYQRLQLVGDIVNYVYGGYTSFFDMADKHQHYLKNLAPFITPNVKTDYLFLDLTPLIMAFSYYVVYVVVNNFVLGYKSGVDKLLIIFNLVIYYLTSGSRGNLFKIITFIFFIYIYLKIKENPKVINLSIKSILKIFTYLILTVVILLSSNYLVGRDIDYENVGGIFSYIFIYTAGPLLNLNNYIRDTKSIIGGTDLFGQQTLAGMYSILEKLTGDSKYKVINITEFLPFTTSDNGYPLGNVYTTFYMFIYDLGFLGVAIFSAIMMMYYIITYKVLTNSRQKIRFNATLIIFAYLFNDLIMLPFSNRFYESVMGTAFVKFVISMILIAIVSRYFVKYHKIKV